MPLLAVLFFLASIALAYLSVFDRMSPMALTVVEWETKVHLPLYCLSFAAALVSGVVAFIPRFFQGLDGRKVKRRTAPKTVAPPPKAPSNQKPQLALVPPPGGDWVQDMVARALALSWEGGVSLLLDDAENVPFTLVLDRVTAEKARRAADALARFCKAIPTPPRVRVRYKDCQDPEVPWHKMVQGTFRRHFTQDQVRVVSQDGWVDVMFGQPDPRWEGRKWLGAG